MEKPLAIYRRAIRTAQYFGRSYGSVRVYQNECLAIIHDTESGSLSIYTNAMSDCVFLLVSGRQMMQYVPGKWCEQIIELNNQIPGAQNGSSMEQ